MKNPVSFDLVKMPHMKTIIRRLPKYWLFQAIGWGLLVLINVFFLITFDRFDRSHLLRVAFFALLGLSLSHLMRYFIRRSDLLQHPVNRQVTGLVLFTFLFAIVAGFLETWLIQLLGLALRGETRVAARFLVLRSAFNAFVIFFFWNSIYYIYHYIEKSRSQQLDTLRLQALVKELELKTIKSHINPHFIFNALNSIRALIDENPTRARHAITELSNILRSSLQSEHQETVSLERELSIVKDYLALEHIRFEDRLRVEYHIDEETLDMPIPPMMLQTLVENAIKHGISQQINGGVVSIQSEPRGDGYELIVRNTGALNGQAGTQGFGLSSTGNRLTLLFGEKASFSIRDAADNMVEARLMIPATAA